MERMLPFFNLMCPEVYGKIRPLPLLRTCDVCLDTYDAKNDLGPHYHWMHSLVDYTENFTEFFFLIDSTNIGSLNLSSLIIRLMKAILTLLEACIPSEGLHSFWTEECRNCWCFKLQSASSPKDLLQLLTHFEGAIKRDYLSAEFETTEELLCYCASSKGATYEFACSGSVPQLPWIPDTTAAVALRLFELDSSIFYTLNQKAESHEKKKVETLTKSVLGQAFSNDVERTERLEFDEYGLIKEDSHDRLRDTPSSFGYRNARTRGGGRQHKKSQRGVKRPTSRSSRRSMKQGETLTIFMQQGVRANGQRHGRGPRTIRRSRTEKKAVAEILQDCLDNESSLKNKAEKPRNSGREELVNFSNKSVGIENDDHSIGMEAGDTDDDSDENLYEMARWGTSPYDATPNRSNETMEMSEEEAEGIENENGYYEEGENNEVNDDDSDRDGDENCDEESESAVSADYSD